MKDEEMAEEYRKSLKQRLIDEDNFEQLEMFDENVEESFLAGLKAGRPQWHEIFEGDPYCYEYWDLPQDRLPEIQNFYFVKLKNGFIKVCELKYDTWSRKKYFYDLHGVKQSDVAEWLDYPTCDEE